MTKHLFKNSTRTLPVILTLNSSEAILTLAGLGFSASASSRPPPPNGATT